MTLEMLSALASVGTLVVITATAIAAVLQLRQQRTANKIAYIQSFFASYEGPELRAAFDFVRHDLSDRLKDPEFRGELLPDKNPDRARHPEISVINFFDTWGLYYRDGVVDRQTLMRVFGGVIVSFWERLAPVIALGSDAHGNTSCQDFEYLAVQAHRWLARHPNGDWPKNEPRMQLPNIEDLYPR